MNSRLEEIKDEYAKEMGEQDWSWHKWHNGIGEDDIKAISERYARECKWVSYVSCDGVNYYLGSCNSENEAALRYNEKAKELFGEYARLNILN